MKPITIPAIRLILPPNKTHKNATDYNRSNNKKVIENESWWTCCGINYPLTVFKCTNCGTFKD